MTIDIRNEVFDLKAATEQVIETALSQVKTGIREIVSKYDIDDEAQRDDCANEVRNFVSKEMYRLNGTTHMTDSVEGFVNAQIVRKLVSFVANPESEILMAHFGGEG